MEKRNDGGPAFPRPLAVSHGGVHEHQVLEGGQDGMSYLDHAAIEAMKSLLTPSGYSPQGVASKAYKMAEAMLAERLRRQEQMLSPGQCPKCSYQHSGWIDRGTRTCLQCQASLKDDGGGMLREVDHDKG